MSRSNRGFLRPSSPTADYHEKVLNNINNNINNDENSHTENNASTTVNYNADQLNSNDNIDQNTDTIIDIKPLEDWEIVDGNYNDKLDKSKSQFEFDLSDAIDDVGNNNRLYIYGSSAVLYDSIKIRNNSGQDRVIVRNDENSGLLPHPFDSELLLDRYDARLLLNQTQFKQLQSNNNNDNSYIDSDVDEDELNHERYAGLGISKDTNDDSDSDSTSSSSSSSSSDSDSESHSSSSSSDNNRKKRKRSNNSRSNAISQDNSKKSPDATAKSKVAIHPDRLMLLQADTDKSEPEPIIKQEFKPLFSIPSDIIIPLTLAEHEVISKTAEFCRLNGGQAEIILKVKQADNPQFQFLLHDNKLNPYFQYLKSTGFKQVQPLQSEPSPSTPNNNNNIPTDYNKASKLPIAPPDITKGPLMNKISAPSVDIDKSSTKSQSFPGELKTNLNGLHSLIQYDSDSDNDSDTHKSANNLTKGDIINTVTVENKINTTSVTDETKPTNVSIDNTTDKNNQIKNNNDNNTNNNTNSSVAEPNITIQRIIARLVPFVAKNGPTFEVMTRIKEQNNADFAFLQPNNEFNLYYKQQLQMEKDKLTPNKSKPNINQQNQAVPTINEAQPPQPVNITSESQPPAQKNIDSIMQDEQTIISHQQAVLERIQAQLQQQRQMDTLSNISSLNPNKKFKYSK